MGYTALYGGWYLDEGTTKPSTAIALCLCALGLWLQLPPGPAAVVPRSRRIGAGLASMLAGGLAILGAVHWLGGGTDPLTVGSYWLITGRQPLGDAYMSPLTSSCLLLLVVLQLAVLLARPPQWLKQSLGLPILAGSTWALIEGLVGFGETTGMALTSGAACLLLTVGTLVLQPSPWIAAALDSRGLTGRLIRLLPLALVAPLVIGGLPDFGQKLGLLSDRTADETQLFLFIASFVGAYLIAVALIAAAERRTQAERELADQQARYQQIVEVSHDGIWVFGADSLVSFANARMEQLLGYGPGELLGRNSAEFFDQEDTATLERIRARTRAGQYAEYELRLKRRDGVQIWTDSSVSPLLEADGTFMGSLGMVTDITARKAAEADRERSRSLLLATLEATPEGIVVVDMQGRIVRTNRGFKELWGLSAELLEQGRQAVLAAIIAQVEDAPAFEASLARLNSSMVEQLADTVRLKDGRVFERNSTPQLLDGQIVGRVITIRDVTAATRLVEDLKASQEFLEAAQAAGNVGSWLFDARSGRVQWSPQTFVIMGLDPATTQPGLDALFAIVHPDDLERVKATTQAYFVAAAPHEIEYRIVLPSGEVRWIHGRSRLELDAAGVPLRLFGLEQDITERKLAQDLQERAVSLLQATLESTGTGVLAVDHADRITAFNQRFAEMWGVPPGLLEAKDDRPVLEHVLSQVAAPEAFAAQVRALYAAPLAESFDTIQLRDGRVFERFSRPQLVDGVSVGRVWSFVDISARLAADAERHRSQQLFKQLAETIDQVFWILTVDPPKLIYVSPAFEQVYGATVEQALSDPQCWLKTMHPDDAPAVLQASEERRLGRVAEPWAGEYRVVHPDGNVRWVKDQMHCLTDDQGALWALCGVAEDVTAQRQAEAERHKLEDQLLQAQKMEAIGTLAGGIAHDFNNILSAIIGYATIVRDALPPDPQLRADQQEVLSAAERAADLVRHILAFSRQHKVETAPVRVSAVIKEVSRLLRASLPATIALSQHVDDDVLDGTVLADVSQLHQVLMNLCTNAGYAMRATGGKLDIAMCAFETGPDGRDGQVAPGSYLLLSVKDTGAGIPPDIRERIFDPFFTTKAVGEGTGLGLSTVHGIVTGMGGAIALYSEIGIGTVFNVYLPRVDKVAGSAPPAPPPPPRGTGRILLVDDEVAIVHMSQIVLERLGYAVLPQTTSVEAWEQFQADPQGVDLLITDQTMPLMTGDVLIQRIRELRPELPVILCSGFSEILTDEKVAALGVTEFLPKPIAPAVLGSAVARALAAGHKVGAAVS